MLGKLFRALVGEKVAPEGESAKGAILGHGTLSLAKRGLPTIAALALGGWLFMRWRDRQRSSADQPS